MKRITTWLAKSQSFPTLLVLTSLALGIPSYLINRYCGIVWEMAFLMEAPTLFIAYIIGADRRKDIKALAQANSSHQPFIITRGGYRHIYFPDSWYAPALWVSNNSYTALKWLRMGSQKVCIAKP
jgi:hypothetical protein